MDQGKRVRRRKNKAVQELGRLIERRQMQRKLYAFPLSFLRQHLKATPNQRNKKKKKKGANFIKEKEKEKQKIPSVSMRVRDIGKADILQKRINRAFQL